MGESYYIGAYWGIRKQTIEECAQQATACLTCLRACDPGFARWFKTGWSRKEALQHEVGLDEANLQALLWGRRSRTDVGHKVMEDLGFLVGLWNGASDDGASAGLTICCGSYAPRPGVNSCVINLPSAESVRARLLRMPVLTTIMECLVSAWAPDWAAVISRSYQEMVPFPSAGAPRIGWLLYLSQARGVVPALPPPVQVVPLASKGSLIILTEERFTASNPVHVEIAQQVAAILTQAGLLGPLR